MLSECERANHLAGMWASLALFLGSDEEDNDVGGEGWLFLAEVELVLVPMWFCGCGWPMDGQGHGGLHCDVPTSVW